VSQPSNFREVLSWLPTDTETVIAAKDFPLPDFSRIEKEPELYTKEVAFQSILLGSWGVKNSSLPEYFKNQKVLLAVEGARHFRSPEGFGLMPFEGCTLIVFADDQSSRADSFVNTSSGGAFRIEEVEEHKILVFQERLESGLWTTFVTFKKPNMLLVATNLDYLREVLARMGGKTGPRALPEILPEWRYVNTNAQYWGLRHYDLARGTADPSSPFFSGTKSMTAPWSDGRAVGLTFDFDPATGKAARITYVSGNPSIAKAERGPLSMAHGGSKFGMVYRDLGPGATEASYNIGDSNAARNFFFILSFILGHGVFA
jgi:hypothetical protein